MLCFGQMEEIRTFSGFSEVSFYRQLRRWYLEGRRFLRIVTGDIAFITEYNTRTHVTQPLALEHTTFQPPCSAWFEPQYLWFRYIYAMCRLHGLFETRWEELQHAGYDMVLPLEAIRSQLMGCLTDLRISYPTLRKPSLLIHNRHHMSYIRIIAFNAEDSHAMRLYEHDEDPVHRSLGGMHRTGILRRRPRSEFEEADAIPSGNSHISTDLTLGIGKPPAIRARLTIP